MTSIQNVSDNFSVKKKTRFLDTLQNVLGGFVTNITPQPHLEKLKVTFCHSRRNVEKRDSKTKVKEAADANVTANVAEEDGGNLFEFLENM